MSILKIVHSFEASSLWFGSGMASESVEQCCGMFSNVPLDHYVITEFGNLQHMSNTQINSPILSETIESTKSW